MPKCDYCHTRKGKRTCPALSGSICPTCCGEHRGVRLDCPTDCPFFVAHETYQQGRAAGAGRAAERLHQYQQHLARREHRLVNLISFLEISIAAYLRQHPGTTDRRIAEALAFLQRKTGTIQVVEQAAPHSLEAFLEARLAEYQQQAPETDPFRLADAVQDLQGFAGTHFSLGEADREYGKFLIGFVRAHLGADAPPPEERRIITS